MFQQAGRTRGHLCSRRFLRRRTLRLDGAPAPQAPATMAQGAPANGSSYPGSNVYNATPPVVILDAGRPYAPYVRPCYGCEPTALEHCLAYARTLNPARFPLPPPRPPLREAHRSQAPSFFFLFCSGDMHICELV